MRSLALAVAFAAACAPISEPQQREAAAPPAQEAPRNIEDLVGKPAPRFSLPSVLGDGMITVPGRAVTLVTFFGTWSMGWQVALRNLEALGKSHPGVSVVAVSMDDEKPREVADRYAPLPIAWSGGMATRTNREWLSGPYGGENKVFVLDRKGTIRFVHGGGKEHTVFQEQDGPRTVEAEIQTLLAEP